MAPRHLIVDGYCLLHRDPDMARDLPRRLIPARQQLLRLVEQAFPLLADRATVVFDSRARRPPDPDLNLAIEVRYAAANETADTVIEQMVASAQRPREIMVVTSDHLEAQTVSAAGAEVMSCAEFLDRARAGLPAYMHRRAKAKSRTTLADFFPTS